MRRLIAFNCNGTRLAATLDEASGAAGLLIVSGGNEIRIGAHRGMAMLARDIAAAGYPVFRFDRRGVGDREGANGGYRSSGPDIAAALAAFRAECPHLQRVIGFGLCDAATALALYPPEGLAGLVLGNPWLVERRNDLPEQAAVRARYAEKIVDPRSWFRLFSGQINIGKLMRGLVHIARPRPATGLPQEFAAGLCGFSGPKTILIAARDATAIAFAEEWGGRAFDNVRARPDIAVVRLESASHSFAGTADQAALQSVLLEALR